MIVVDTNVDVVEPSETAFAGTGEGLRADLRLRTSDRLVGRAGEHLPLHVDAINTGTVRWSDAANIRLGFRWYRYPDIATEVPKYEGRVVLLGHVYGDVPPGAGYAFAGDLRAPDEPGEYLVQVSMLSELVAWFEIEPIEIRVRVVDD